ncbi:hypothetical protein KEM48_001939 [Puccinia striiformis f. sp. tritici PST-130]|nr:hypothetical protein KEM48_001939 [Puccinia striiformis f. sp. tritici PST-130]
MILPCFANTLWVSFYSFLNCKFDNAKIFLLVADIGVTSPPPTSDTKTQKAELEKPLILLSEKTISALQDIIPSLEAAATQRQPLLTIAEDSLAAVKAPGFGDDRNLSPMILLFLPVKLARTTNWISSLKSQPQIYLIRAAITDASTFESKKTKLQELLTKLSGGVALIKVRGHSKDKVGEKKDRFDNALDATRAVVEEGIVPGRGTALLEASKALDGLMLANFELGASMASRLSKSSIFNRLISTSTQPVPVPVLPQSITDSLNSSVDPFKLLANKLNSMAVYASFINSFTNNSSHSKSIEASYEFGKHLGLAFQIVDDISDYTTCDESSGKVANRSDLNEACVVDAPEDKAALPPANKGKRPFAPIMLRRLEKLDITTNKIPDELTQEERARFVRLDIDP